ncbi:TrmH family RNA methyltransferase [Flavobacterium caeni]|uniref:RNA methyltransferase, TrmH family n=1 Tax=Flavobacterium caeni TaxID=490189 RepID=A0A1G5GLM2_9FLAO|nr:RNA methyltransferase [Flavobacterium caeni]SCY52110.1 RNA methyltransferase, TrmH family [Flavobacterium caeni]
MVGKNQIKLIASLQQKKFRQTHGLFLAEGVKGIAELLASDFELHHLYETADVFPEVSSSVKTRISEADLKKMSALSAPNNCLAVFRIKKPQPIEEKGLVLALDDIRDPGNLGTIIRLCDWFGIKELVCSQETVDVFNPKVVQATMGSLARVNVHYVELPAFLTETSLPVLGTFMDGENIYARQLPKAGVIVMGNEANGISAAVERAVGRRLTIPRYGSMQTESLNVATATAIVLSEFRRN